MNNWAHISSVEQGNTWNHLMVASKPHWSSLLNSTWCQMGSLNAFWDGYLPKTEFEFSALKMCLAQTGMNVNLCSVHHHSVYPLSNLAYTFACGLVCNLNAYWNAGPILTNRITLICSSGLDIWLTLLVHKQRNPECLLLIHSNESCVVKKANSEEGTLGTVLKIPLLGRFH